MILLRITLLTLLAFALNACGTYRGRGDYKTPSDYAMDPQTREFYLTESVKSGTYIPKGDFTLHWPVNNVHINRGFRPASDPKHAGVDLGGKKGTPILAAHEGVVIYAGRDFRGYGKMVMIEYNQEWATLYAHLNDITVKEGRIVRAGDPIGEMGRTGHATGVHLHFELIQSRKPVDPLNYLSRAGRIAERIAEH